jgi:threonine/homoserine/homoserine lactone efflux protein
MVELGVLPGFLLAVLLICLAPGPDMAFIIATSTDRGSRAGVQSALGMAIGMALWTVATALGLAALLHAEPAALLVIRVVGAAYLLWLGITTLRSARRSSASPQAPSAGGRNLVVRGMMANLINPKVVVFFAAFLPPFVRASAGPASLQLLTLGGLFLLTGLGVDCMVALAAGHLRQALRAGGRLAVGLSLTAGVVLCVLAGTLAAGVA